MGSPTMTVPATTANGNATKHVIPAMAYRPDSCRIASAFSRTALLARPMKIGIAAINSKPITKRVRLTSRVGRLMSWAFGRSRLFSSSIALAGIALEPSARVGVRHSLHQFADFRFQKLIRHDQRLHGVTRVAAASRDGLVGCKFEPTRFRDRLAVWIG